VFNRGYNPQGRYDAGSYRFPYRDNEFDFVILTSVFTHMVPLDLQNYLAEVARVTKVGGRCLITYVLRNEESLRLQEEGRSKTLFLHAGNGYWTTNPRTPEDLTCYDEAVVRLLYDRNGLVIDDPIHYGKWCGRTDTLSWQDVVVARKARAGCLAHPRVPLRRRAAVVVRRLFHGPLQKYLWRGATIAHVERARKAAGDPRRAA
jgi:SAM-dependent methyltransferase